MAAVTVISGEGIGPEVVSAARKVLDQAVPNIEWDEVPAGEDAYNKYGTAVPPHTLESIRRTRVVLEGPLNYDEGADHAPPHSILRKQLGLRVNIRHAIHFPGVPSPFPGTHLVIIRDVTEDLSRGVQQMVGPDAGIAVKYITRASVERSAEMAYRYAVDHGFHRVTIANQVISQRTTDGIFLSAAFAVAERFPGLKVEEELLDSLAMHLVTRPQEYQVIFTSHFYGGIFCGLCAGVAGGVGLMPGCYLSDDGITIFEAGHGTAPKYTGMNKVNPTAMILSGAMLLEHIGEIEASQRVRAAVAQVIAEAKTLTYDLGGTSGTREMADAVIAAMPTAVISH